MATQIPHYKPLDQIDDQAHELLTLISVDGATVSEAAKLIDYPVPVAHKAVRHAIKMHGVEQLMKAYPGAGPTIVQLNSTKPVNKTRYKSKQQVAATFRPPVSADHPDDIDKNNLLPALQDKLLLVISYVDRYNVSNAKVGELTTLIKTLFEVTQTLQGKPSSISQRETVRSLDTLMPALVKEAKRRGLIGELIDVTPEPKASSTRGPGKGVRGTGSPGEGGPEADPPPSMGVGPIPPSATSDFSKLLDDF